MGMSTAALYGSKVPTGVDDDKNGQETYSEKSHIINDLELPIENPPMSGPAIDFLNSPRGPEDIDKYQQATGKNPIEEMEQFYAKWYKMYQEKISAPTKWDYRFMDLAFFISEWSKDPSRKVGAVIVAPDRSIISLGYNGFARGVEDSKERLENREIKYELVVHAEINAILTAKKDLTSAILYSTLLPCSRCAAVIINSGIRKVVYFTDKNSTKDNSKVHFDLTQQQFKEAGVVTIPIELERFEECLATKQ